MQSAHLLCCRVTSHTSGEQMSSACSRVAPYGELHLWIPTVEVCRRNLSGKEGEKQEKWSLGPGKDSCQKRKLQQFKNKQQFTNYKIQKGSCKLGGGAGL